LALAGAFLFAANKLACECGKQKRAMHTSLSNGLTGQKKIQILAYQDYL